MTPSIRWLVLVLFGGLAFAQACSREEPQSAAPPAAAAAAEKAAAQAAASAEAKQLFADRCAPCHGVMGAGNGTKSATLTPKPRNFQDPEWQKEVTDAYFADVVVNGSAAVGKSAVMPASPDLAGKPELLKALRLYVRSLAH